MTSSAEQSSPTNKSVYDYLYIDQTRLSHIYAQLSSEGLIASSKRTSKNSDKNALKGTGDALIFKGEYSNEEGAESGIEHQIDTSYSRPLDVLNALFNDDFIANDIDSSKLGSFVLFKGSLSLMDFAVIKEMWPNIMQIHVENEALQQPQKQREAFIKKQKKENENVVSLLKHVPHLIQGNIISDSDYDFWFTMKPECMLISSNDLMLKHGKKIQGSWHMLGIVDAFPDAHDLSAPQVNSINMAALLDPFKEGLRASFGRASHQFGITPIMLFKVIRKCD